MPTSRAPAPHFPQLDGVRCLAVLGVLWFHTVPGVAPSVGPYGVRVFFVLSAFLITGILLRARDGVWAGRQTRGAALRTFYLRRTLRIFPVYYLFLLALVLVGMPAVREEWAWHAVYLTNWWIVVRDTLPPGTAHLWSLAVEEQFYLVWPLLLLVTPARRLPWVFVGAIALAIVTRAVIVGLTTTVATSAAAWTAPTVVCLDSLGLGALLAWHRHTAPEDRAVRARWLRRAWRLGGGLLVVVVACQAIGRGWKIVQLTELTAISLVAVWAIDRAADGFTGWAGAVLGWAPVRYLGRISYGMYLVHPALMWYATQWGMRYPAVRPITDGGVAFFVGITLATVAVASLSWRWIESPLNRMKDQLAGARRATEPLEHAARATPAYPSS